MSSIICDIKIKRSFIIVARIRVVNFQANKKKLVRNVYPPLDDPQRDNNYRIHYMLQVRRYRVCSFTVHDPPVAFNASVLIREQSRYHASDWRDFLQLLHFDIPTCEKILLKITSSLLLSLMSSSCSSSLLLCS